MSDRLLVCATLLSLMTNISADGPTCTSGAQFPNLAFLGHGYDVIRDNPQPWASGPGVPGETFDPGWAGASIIDMQDYSAGGEYGGCKVPNAAVGSVRSQD